jgi:hypothetical protein
LQLQYQPDQQPAEQTDFAVPLKSYPLFPARFVLSRYFLLTSHPMIAPFTLIPPIVLGLFFIQRYRFLTIVQFANIAGLSRHRAEDLLCVVQWCFYDPRMQPNSMILSSLNQIFCDKF